MADTAYARSNYHPSELSHRYGDGVHLLDDPFAWSLLAQLGDPHTVQPELGRLVRQLYQILGRTVIAAELPREAVERPTRMASSVPSAAYRGLAVAPGTKVVTAAIARAGTQPSQAIYELLNQVLEPANVRQDHLFMSRRTGPGGEVTGVDWHDAKMGREIAGRHLLLPDPMGATGSSMIKAIDYYLEHLDGRPDKSITMHLMITPEYLRNLRASHPEAIVYALRLDRGLSSARALAAEPGEHWDEERGLTDTDYIVPGAGGVGELLNNAWV